MPSGFSKGGVDLDDIFDPFVQGPKPAVTGHAVAGIDLADRYAPLVYGAQAAATGFTVPGGADLNTLFAAKGTAMYSLSGLDGGYFQNDQAKTYQDSVSGNILLTIKADGTWNVRAGNSEAPMTTLDSGTWNVYGEPVANFDVRFSAVVTSGTDGQQSNGAPVWTQLNADRSFQFSLVSAGTMAEKSAEIALTIEIARRAGGQVVSSSVTNLAINLVGYV